MGADPLDPPATVVVGDAVVAPAGAHVGGAAALDATGLFVAPGFVDLQCNGAHGIDLTAEPERLWELAALLPRDGVTAFLPTIVSCPPAVIERAQATLARRPAGFVGAEPLGLHLEGPLLSPARRGAHPAEHLRPVDLGAIEGWRRDTGVALVTLAPELPGALEAVGRLCRQGVVVAMGHTDATTTEAAAGVDAGITVVTHLFNAMAPFAHRQPGPVGVALTDPRLTVGVIADGLHVEPVAVAAAWAALGPNRLALVTDAVAAMGGDGTPSPRVADRAVTVGPNGVRTADGRLAGSLLAMDQAVRNLVAYTGCRPAAAVACATVTPARALSATDRGHLGAGARGDVVLLDDDLAVVATVVGGRVAHRRD